MKTVNIATLKSHLSEILDEAEKGEEIKVTRRGKPIVIIKRTEKTKEPFDFKKLDVFRNTLPLTKISSNELFRILRDEGY